MPPQGVGRAARERGSMGLSEGSEGPPGEEGSRGHFEIREGPPRGGGRWPQRGVDMAPRRGLRGFRGVRGAPEGGRGAPLGGIRGPLGGGP